MTIDVITIIAQYPMLRSVSQSHLQQAHDDRHGRVVVALAGGRGRLRRVALGVGCPLEDLLGQRHGGGHRAPAQTAARGRGRRGAGHRVLAAMAVAVMKVSTRNN